MTKRIVFFLIFLKAWKFAITIPILKKTNSQMTPTATGRMHWCLTATKIYECFHQCTAFKILPPDQFGFDKFLATSFLSTDKVWQWCHYHAFDTVWFNGLSYKMRYNHGFSEHLYTIIYNYLTERYFVVKLRKKTPYLHTLMMLLVSRKVVSSWLLYAT